MSRVTSKQFYAKVELLKARLNFPIETLVKLNSYTVYTHGPIVMKNGAHYMYCDGKILAKGKTAKDICEKIETIINFISLYD